MSAKGSWKTRIQKTAAVLLALIAWQAAALALNQKFLLASPIDVAVRLSQLIFEPAFLQTVWFSFRRIAGGFFAGFACGTVLAVIAGRFKVVEILLWPYMMTIKSVPVASFIVIALFFLSSSSLATFISFLMVLPIIYTNVLNGIKSTDIKMTQMADVFRVPWRRRFVYIYIPQVKPHLLSACSVGLGLAWKAGIAAEIIGIPDGSIGEMLYEAKVYYISADLLAWTVVVILISQLFEKIMMALLRSGFKGVERL